MSTVAELANQAKVASRPLARLSTKKKNTLLLAVAEQLLARQKEILQANQGDVQAAKEAGLAEALLDRLELNPKRFAEMVEGVRKVAALSDPVGEVLRKWKQPNGLEISKIRVPLGLIGIIYESRPNVTVDSAVLCLKTGNATLLRGGREAKASNRALASALNEAALKQAEEIIAAYKREGAAVTKRDNVHRMADANKAFAHFAW